MSWNQTQKQFDANLLLDYVQGTTHIDILDTDPTIAKGSVSGTAVANSAIASIIVPAGARVMIKRVLMTNEGTTSPTTAHYDLYNVTTSAVIEPMGYLSSPGETERIGTFKDPVTSFVNAGVANVTIALTIAAPTNGNTYTGSIRYSFMDDTRPSV